MSASSSFTFPRSERLKSKKILERTFAEGEKVKAWPLVVRRLKTELPEEVTCQVMVSVSKRLFKRAVDRNRIKRLLRENWRLQKNALVQSWATDETQNAVVFIYMGKEMPTFEIIEKAMGVAVEKMISKSNTASPTEDS
ncbi:MAG: ribonuclease P protein component [Flavobacteriales bacterium]